MKQLTCEMCGSNDIIKQNGVFVCQSCGCKYTSEEAKKLIIEGSIDISGSKVSISNYEQISNSVANKIVNSKKSNGVVLSSVLNICTILLICGGTLFFFLTGKDMNKNDCVPSIIMGLIYLLSQVFNVIYPKKVKVLIAFLEGIFGMSFLYITYSIVRIMECIYWIFIPTFIISIIGIILLVVFSIKNHEK